MAITSAIVLFAVVWWMVFFVVLPLRLTTQDEAGEIAPGTPGSAPANLNMRRKLKWTTAVAVVVWGVIFTIIVTGAITVRDIDMMGRMPAETLN